MRTPHLKKKKLVASFNICTQRIIYYNRVTKMKITNRTTLMRKKYFSQSS